MQDSAFWTSVMCVLTFGHCLHIDTRGEFPSHGNGLQATYADTASGFKHDYRIKSACVELASLIPEAPGDDPNLTLSIVAPNQVAYTVKLPIKEVLPPGASGPSPKKYASRRHFVFYGPVLIRVTKGSRLAVNLQNQPGPLAGGGTYRIKLSNFGGRLSCPLM